MFHKEDVTHLISLSLWCCLNEIKSIGVCIQMLFFVVVAFSLSGTMIHVLKPVKFSIAVSVIVKLGMLLLSNM